MCWGCGSSSPITPSTPNVTGVWIGEQTLKSFTGGECLATLFDDLLGFPAQFHATLAQSGHAVIATSDIDRTGDVCNYTGSLDGNVLVLRATSCTEAGTVGLRCTNGALRDLLHASVSLRATVNGDGITGTALEIDNVVVSGSTGNVGMLSGNSSFTLKRQ